MVRDVIVSCILRIHHSFYMNAQYETFSYIYKGFKPNIDYSSYCYKIVNRHYLDYIVGKFNS